VQPVTDAFLLNMAEVSATLIGLFFVGIFFYIESGLRRLEHVRDSVEPYLRAGTRITLIVFAIPLGLSLSLVALDLVWSRILFAILCVTLIAANVDSLVRVRGVSRASRSPGFLVMELVTTALAALLIVAPWALGGLHPTRKDLTWAILLSFAAGFLSIFETVMSVFDISRIEDVERRDSLADAERDRLSRRPGA
jgi:predicted secreted protein